MNGEQKKTSAPEEEKQVRQVDEVILGTDRYLVSIPGREEDLDKLPIEKIVDIAEKQVEVYKKIRVISIKMTNERDWIDQRGKPYLTDDGAEAVAILWGIDHFDINVSKSHSEDEEGRYYIYKATGKFFSKKLRRYIEEIGTCSQRDEFFGTVEGTLKKMVDIDETTIQKSAVTNLFVRGIKTCCGLKNITYEELHAAGIDISKIAKIEYKTGAKKAAKTLTAEAMKNRKKLWDICLEFAKGKEEDAKKFLKQFTYFKKGKDERFISDIKELVSEKWIEASLKRAEKEKEEADKGYEADPSKMTEEEKKEQDKLKLEQEKSG